MHFSRRFILAGLLGLAAAPVLAQGVGFGLGMHDVVVRAGGGAAPLDAFAQPSGAYSFRKLRTAYTGNAIRIRRASDNAELNIGFLGFVPGLGAPWDEAAAVAHCAATTCFGRTWYDQSGLGKDIGNATPANQPQLIFNCNGALPCLRTTAAQVLQTVSATYVPVPPITFSAVANRSAGTGVCYWPFQYNVNSLSSRSAVANQWLLFAGTGLAVVAADNAWHSGIGVVNGALSVVRIDGVETTGTTTGGTTAGALVGFWGAAATTCNAAEVIAWDSYAMPPAERAVWGANQKSFWGTP